MNRLAARKVLELSSRVRTRISDFRRARCWIAAMSCTPTPSLSALRPMSQASCSAASPRPATYSCRARAYCLARSRSSGFTPLMPGPGSGRRAPARQDVVGELLRRQVRQRPVEEAAPDAVGREDQRVAPADGDDLGRERRQMDADDTAADQQSFDPGAAGGRRAEQHALDV